MSNTAYHSLVLLNFLFSGCGHVKSLSPSTSSSSSHNFYVFEGFFLPPFYLSCLYTKTTSNNWFFSLHSTLQTTDHEQYAFHNRSQRKGKKTQ